MKDCQVKDYKKISDLVNEAAQECGMTAKDAKLLSKKVKNKILYELSICRNLRVDRVGKFIPVIREKGEHYGHKGMFGGGIIRKSHIKVKWWSFREAGQFLYDNSPVVRLRKLELDDD